MTDGCRPAAVIFLLYETLGDEAAGEMIDWMRRVDHQRAELRELNEADIRAIRVAP